MKDEQGIVHINKIWKQDAVAFGIMLAYSMLVLWRVRYGFSVPDEGSYIAQAFRYITGDGLISDEWHVAQFFSFVQYIPVKIYLLIFKSTDGILLYLRILSVFFLFATSAFSYLLIRRKCGWFSVMMTTVYMLNMTFVRMPLFSYYLVATGMLYCACISFVVSGEKRHKYFWYVLSGILFAISVTCFCVFAVIFFIYTGVMIVKYARKEESTEEYNIKTYASVLLGVCLTAVVFLLYLFNHTEIKELILSFKYLFWDPERPEPFAQFFYMNELVFRGVNLSPVFVLVSFIAFFDKSREKRRLSYIIVIAVATLVNAFLILCKMTVSNEQVTYLSYLAAFASLSAMAIFREYNSKISYALCFCGLMSGCCVLFASAAGKVAAAPMINICTVACFDCMYRYFLNCKEKVKRSKRKQKADRISSKYTVYPLCVCIMMLYIVTPFCMISYSAMWEIQGSDFNSLKHKVNEGPYKGIITTDERYNIYNLMLEDLSYAKSRYDGLFLVPDCFSWMYVYIGRPYGCFSSWVREGWLEKDERFKEYYSVYPERIPQIIYIPAVDAFYYEKADSSAMYEKVNLMFEYKKIRSSAAGDVLLVKDYKGDR